MVQPTTDTLGRTLSADLPADPIYALTVTATASEALDRLFLRAGVMQN